MSLPPHHPAWFGNSDFQAPKESAPNPGEPSLPAQNAPGGPPAAEPNEPSESESLPAAEPSLLAPEAEALPEQDFDEERLEELEESEETNEAGQAEPGEEAEEAAQGEEGEQDEEYEDWDRGGGEADREVGEDQEGEESQEGDDESASILAGWKAALRYDFENWLASLEEIPELSDTPPEIGDSPDLYSFYEQLAAASAETRKTNRRTAEVVSQWGETLAKFEQSLGPLRETTALLAAAQPKEGQLSRAHCLMLVELLDRLHRLTRAFVSPPARRSWWAGHDARWRQAWASQRQAADILAGHLEDWLRREGVTRLETLGRRFDPTVMVAVAVETTADRPAQAVVEESVAGYLRHGELLRAAQVKVTRQP